MIIKEDILEQAYKIVFDGKYGYQFQLYNMSCKKNTSAITQFL
jgi:hypothetical protein